ncbi:unnamed protein product [Mucor fragilis]
MVDLTPELLEKPDFHNQVKTIIKNGDTSSLTANQIRSKLETHYGLEKDALKQKPYKKMVGEIIDKTLSELSDEQESQEDTPVAINSSREASPQKRKAVSPEKEEEVLFVKKKAKVDFDGDANEEEDVKPKKTTRKRKQSKKIILASEDEENEQDSADSADNKMKDEKMKDASDDEDEADDDDDEEEEEGSENGFSTPPPRAKKTTKKTTKSSAATTRDEEAVKRLKQFINKCGVRKVW